MKQGKIAKNRQTELEGLIQKLMRDVAKLAPNPNHPDHFDPLFISTKNDFVPPQAYANMVRAQSLLQAEFSGQALKPNTAMKIAARFTPKTRTLQGAFRCVNSGALQKAYLRDLPKRLGLESCLSYYLRKLCSLNQSALRYELDMAA